MLSSKTPNSKTPNSKIPNSKIPNSKISGKKILVKVTASIAAYKSCYLISVLVQNGYQVKVACTKSALQFVGAATLEGLSGHKVETEMFEAGSALNHIELMRWADLIIVCPATANFINKTSNGIADDLITTLFLAHDFSKPYLVAPAMNSQMLTHPATQQSLQRLKSFGITVLETDNGTLACGEVGPGKLLAPEQIFKEIERHLKEFSSESRTSDEHIAQFSFNKNQTENDKTKRVLITAGGTIEPIDDVRVITNRSTGSTGAYLAECFVKQGYQVDYLRAKNAVLPNLSCLNLNNFSNSQNGSKTVYNPMNKHLYKHLFNPLFRDFEFETFSDLSQLLKSLLAENPYQAVLHLAAVSDFHVDHVSQVSQVDRTDRLDHKEAVCLAGKLPSGKAVTLTLKPNPKLIDSIKIWSRNSNTQLVGFKLTSGATENEKNEKIQNLFEAANCDYVVHNDFASIKNHNHSFEIYNPVSKICACENKKQLFSNLYKLLNKLPNAKITFQLDTQNNTQAHTQLNEPFNDQEVTL